MKNSVQYFFIFQLIAFIRFVNAQSVTVQPGVQVGFVNQSTLKEVSGIAQSRSVANTLWAHEDSGADPVFYGIDITTGQVHTKVLLQGAPAVDWEDMAIASKPGGGNYLYFGDIGDNGANRNSGIDIIRITEPDTKGNDTITQANYKVKRVNYPGIVFLREEDAESLFADPLNGDIYIIQKLNPGRLFRLTEQAFDSTGISFLEPLGSINAPLNKPTGADISPDGRYIIVRNSAAGGTVAYLFVRDVDNDETVESALKGNPVAVNLQSEPQGEAIAWASDGSGFYSISEGSSSSIWFYAVIPSVSAVKLPSQTSVNFFPNPAERFLFLDYPELDDNPVEIFNSFGEKQSFSYSNPIDVSGLPSGIYFLHVGGEAKRFLKK